MMNPPDHFNAEPSFTAITVQRSKPALDHSDAWCEHDIRRLNALSRRHMPVDLGGAVVDRLDSSRVDCH
ncbi:MAG: hypothetical protein ACK54H_04435, partial [Phycisphaerales bacterium]